MKSFGLIRTTPILSSNIKIIVSSEYLYLESIDSDESLSDSKYKKIILHQNSTYNEEISKFWKGTRKEIVFKIKNNYDSNIIYNDYKYQIDDIYLSGASNIVNTTYNEMYEYFSPLHITPGKLPENFIIFRVDGPGVISLNSENFKDEILNKMKVVKNFSLTKGTKIGDFLYNSFSNIDLPNSSVDLSFDINEFTYWNGIDLETGEYIRKGKLMEKTFSREKTFSDGHTILTNGFKDNDLVYPFLINLSFLFDDKPSSPDSLNKWSINRYYGFYGNLEEIKKVTPYNPPKLINGLKLINNVFTLNGKYVSPFERNFKKDKTYFIEYNSTFYKIEYIEEDNKFKIISDIDLPIDVDNNFNKNTITFEDNNIITYISGTTFDINNDGDIFLIKIDGKFYRLLKKDNKWTILSDYNFSVNNNIFNYYTNKTDESYQKSINLNDVDSINFPVVFEIYRFNFTEIKDFDNSILNTKFADFEYDINNDIIDTEEPKLYEPDLSYDLNVPQTYLFKNKIISLPVSNEYLSTYEIYEIKEDSNLNSNKIWKKNPEFIKWGIQNSISNNDYPYMFNINKNGDIYNRTTDVSYIFPDRQSRNLDYFYTLHDISYNFGYNINTKVNNTLSIQHDEFSVNEYFNNYNYFNDIFSKDQFINDKYYYTSKYSRFVKSDGVISNNTVFKGMKIFIYDILNVSTHISNENVIVDNINISHTNDFENYKFSIILSNLDVDIDNEFSSNYLLSDWNVIKKWEKNKYYNTGDIVLFESINFKNNLGQYGFNGYGEESIIGTDDVEIYEYPNGDIEPLIINNDFTIDGKSATGPNNGINQLFKCVNPNITTDPTETIMDNISDWIVLPNLHRTIFYDNGDYIKLDLSIHDYTYLTTISGNNYNYLSHFIFYNNEYYKCVNDQNLGDSKTPLYIGISNINGKRVMFWEKIEEFNSNKIYFSNDIVTNNNALYFYDKSTESLKLIHTFSPIKELSYNENSIIYFNKNFYISNITGSIIDNGINIYINKKEKNILINIYFNDNLIPTYNIKRDELYKMESQQMVASNFISVINNLSSNKTFINDIKYYILDENNIVNKYDLSNIEKMPYLLHITQPTKTYYFKHSLKITGISLDYQYPLDKILENNEINDYTEINNYNNSYISYKIHRYDNFEYNNSKEYLHRFSGYYSPIFSNINLFEKNNNDIDNDGNIRLIKFNTVLNNFGEVNEIIKSKIGKNNVLNYPSIYPQIDNMGYFVDNHLIFKSTWDNEFYKKIVKK